MSSFRPTVGRQEANFVITSFGPERKGLGVDFHADEIEIEPESVEDDTSSESSAAVDLWSPERVSELEAAAFARGAESARAEADRVENACRTIESVLPELESTAKKVVAANRELLLDLALEIARHWVSAELRSDPALVGGLLDRAIEAVSDDESLRLRLHPEILDSLDASRVERWRDEHGLVCEADTELEPGDFELEGARSRIDGRSESILRKLRKLLTDTMGENAAGGVES